MVGVDVGNPDSPRNNRDINVSMTLAAGQLTYTLFESIGAASLSRIVAIGEA